MATPLRIKSIEASLADSEEKGRSLKRSLKTFDIAAMGIAVAVGNVDAHVTAPAAQAVDPGQMVAIMGTSTCHVMNADVLREVVRTIEVPR